MHEPFFWFQWECFHHVDDFVYCLSQTWLILLAIYLTSAVIFGLFAVAVVHLRRRRRRERLARQQEEVVAYRNCY